MKIRTDYVSNSSSSSFIIENPKHISKQLNKDMIPLLFQCQYVYFNGIKRKKDIEDFKARVMKTFPNSEIEDDGGDIYITLNTDDTDDLNWNEDEIGVLSELFNRCNETTMSFGDYYDDGCKAMQIATLLDYIYGAEICGEDHFDYDPVRKLGISRKDEKQ